MPPGVATLVADLTAKDPRARPAYAGLVAERAERLRDALISAPLGPPRLPPAALAAAKMDVRTATWPLPLVLPGVRQRGRPRRRVLAGLNAVVVCAALAAAGWGISGGHHAGSDSPSATRRPGPQPGHSAHSAKAAHRNGATRAHAPGPVALSRSEAPRKRHTGKRGGETESRADPNVPAQRNTRAQRNARTEWDAVTDRAPDTDRHAITDRDPDTDRFAVTDYDPDTGRHDLGRTERQA